MSLLSMSFSASIMIIVIIVLRALWIHQLPKRMFLILWSVALLRLLVPFSVPSTFSIYFLISQSPLIMDRIADTSIVNLLPVVSYEQKQMTEIPENEIKKDTVKDHAKSPNAGEVQTKEQAAGEETPTAQENEKQKKMEQKNREPRRDKNNTSISIQKKDNFSVWTVVWMMGSFICTVLFCITYILCYRQFCTSLPIENAVTKEWLVSHGIRRAVSIRQTDCISAPLAYGFLHPVILMPKSTEWEDSRRLQYILEHEFIHIQRLDAIKKLFLAAAVCIHWFNPLVWVLYIFANRDIELFCDETVVRRFGEKSKSAYALTLIHMEEMKSIPIPFGNHFSRDASEERITAIMKFQKNSAIANILAVILMSSVTVLFATSAFAVEEQEMDSVKITQSSDIQNTVLFAKNESDFSLLKPENGIGLQSAVHSEEAQPEILLSAFRVDIKTELSEQQQTELLEEYEKYGVYEKAHILYYNDRPIRCLVDKYQEETSNENGGKNINTIRVYCYFNEKGVVDVNAIRKYKIGKSAVTELFRDVIGMAAVTPVAVDDIIADLPQNSVNTLARKAAAEGRYGALEKMVPFVDTEVVDEIAEKMMEERKKLGGIAGFMSNNCVGKLAESGYQRWGFAYVRELLPFMTQDSIDALAGRMADDENYNGLKEIEAYQSSM